MAENLQNLFLKYRFKNLSSLILFLGLAFGAFWVLRPFLAPIFFGIIFTIELYPLFLRMTRKLKSKVLTASILVGLCSFAVIGPFIYLAVRASKAVTGLISAGITTNPTFVKVSETSGRWLTDYNLNEYFDQYGPQMLEKFGTFATELAQSFLGALPEIGLFVFISLFTIFFGLRYFDRCLKFLRFYSLLPEATFQTVITTLKQSIHSTIIANVATGALQAFLIAAAVKLLTDYDSLLIFFVSFVCSFIPIIGAGPICFLVGVLELINGNNGTGTTILIFSFVVGLADNVCRTYFNSGESQDEVPTFATFLAIIGGVIVFGFPGLFFGPLVVDLFFRLSPTLISEAISEHSESTKES